MSDETAIVVKDFQFPTQVDQAHNVLEEVSNQIKRLESLKKQLRKYLCDNIPVEYVDEKHAAGEVAGIHRMQFVQLRTSYSDAMREIVDTLVPKTRLGEVKDIVERHTKVVTIDRFSTVAEEDFGYGE